MENNNLETLERNATNAAISWAKSDFGYFSMEKAVNEFIEAIGGNRAIDNDTEAIRLGRRAAALRINVNAIHALNKDQEQKLNTALMKIAEVGVPRQSRGFHR